MSITICIFCFIIVPIKHTFCTFCLLLMYQRSDQFAVKALNKKQLLLLLLCARQKKYIQ